MIISQISTATGRLTSATVAAPMAWNDGGHRLTEDDSGDDAERDPQSEVALEDTHGGRFADRGVLVTAVASLMIIASFSLTASG